MLVKTGPAHTISGPTLTARWRGFCLLCDEYTQPGQLIGQVRRYGWVHAHCADQGNLAPTHTAECGGYTKVGHPCRMAAVPGKRCKFHRDQ
jgi:hypothetical protein